MPDRLRVSIIQMRSGLDAAANRAAVEPWLREAAAAGARLIATPEMTTRLDRNRERLIAAARPEAQDPEIAAWGRLAREHGVFLLLGSHASLAGADKVYNRSYLFDPKGAVCARYDKIHLFDVSLGGGETYSESQTVEPGGEAVVAEAAGARIGLTICYDLRFPALYSALARAGAQIIAAPSAFTRPTGEAHWETLLRARAIETGAFILAPAQGGAHEDGRRTWGRSMIISPWGDILGAFNGDEPGVITADLDLAQVDHARERLPAWRSARPFREPTGGARP